MAGDLSKQQRREQARRRAEQRRTRRILVWVVAVLVVGGATAIALAGGGGDDDGAGGGAVTTAVEGWVLPAMGSTAQQQETLALDEFSGSPTIVNFFASWCVACDAELPAFVAVTQQVGDQIDFVGVASRETGDPMFMPERHGLDGLWPLARDAGPEGSGLTKGLGARGMPVTAFYDADGSLLRVHVGALTESSLLGTIDELYGIEPEA